jgi:hypothetical protein
MKRFQSRIFGRTTMADERGVVTEPKKPQPVAKAGGFLGSLKDALAAAARDDTQRGPKSEIAAEAAGSPPQKSEAGLVAVAPVTLSAAEAAREVKAQTSLKPQDKHGDLSAPPTTRVVRGVAPVPHEDAVRTRLVRGKVEVKRGEFEQDPVVGWLVVVGGPGLGSYRPIFEGNNTVGRGPGQRIPVDFGDDTISAEEQAYIRYDSSARSFLFVPNLAKTNVVSVNDKRPTGAVELNQMDVITMGRTQLVFVPFCGADFDWSELTDAKT